MIIFLIMCSDIKTVLLLRLEINRKKQNFFQKKMFKILITLSIALLVCCLSNGWPFSGGAAEKGNPWVDVLWEGVQKNGWHALRKLNIVFELLYNILSFSNMSLLSFSLIYHFRVFGNSLVIRDHKQNK